MRHDMNPGPDLEPRRRVPDHLKDAANEIVNAQDGLGHLKFVLDALILVSDAESMHPTVESALTGLERALRDRVDQIDEHLRAAVSALETAPAGDEPPPAGGARPPVRVVKE